MASKDNVITIDGPAGSGKSTVAKAIAEKLKFLYIDTGAMYRALTLKALEEHIDIHDETKLVDLSKVVDIKIESANGSLKVYLDGRDVTNEIRRLSVSQNVKFIAKVKGVRENMVKLQRSLAKTSGGAVMEGRDIGTVVFPNAKYKFYLDASFDERVKRRFKEFESKNLPEPWEAVSNDVKERDHTDRTRTVAPLKKAEDAVYVDTTSMTIDEVVSTILAKIKQ